MPYPGFRKFTITLTIVVIVVHQSCGFALHRMTTGEASEPTTDLALQESLQIQSLKRPNDIKQGKDTDTIKATKNKYRFNSQLKDTTVVLDNMAQNEKTVGITQTNFDTIPNAILQEEDERIVESTNVISETTPQEINTLNKIVVNTTTLTNSVPLQTSNKEFTENVMETEIQTTNTLVEFTTIDIQLTETEEPTTETEEPTTEHPNMTELKNEDEVKDTTERVNDQIAIDSEATENLSVQKLPKSSSTTVNSMESENSATEIETQNLSNSDSTTVNNYETENTASEIETTSHISSKPIATSDINKQAISTTPETTTVLSLKSEVFTPNSMKAKSSEFSEEASQSGSTIVEVKFTKDTSITSTEPSWRKYTTIERKRPGSFEETSSTEKETTKKESIQTTLPIPSLEMLREDFTTNANHPTMAREIQVTNLETESKPTSELIETLGTVTSKRAGFLDLSKITSAHYQETSTDENTVYSKMPEIIATDVEAHEMKNVNHYETQGQLAEDAINEELLKEEIIIDHQQSAKIQDERKPIADNMDLTTRSNVVEDPLSVKPISQDRRTTLYTVGPNYKPMKRIEVQQAKPFVRDPDDNSWRNESISSLGIVFKPKSSSAKSFKEVLKTKTETEFNNLQDKDSKDDTPELRERLEKIAEVRKSKKKRINKFGEVVYTDYEENGSAERTSIPKVETSTLKIYNSETQTTPDQMIETEVTSPMTTTENHSKYWKNKLEAINKEELFRDLGLDILTTQKPKKPYNVADYYDTTDEYDADYVTQPKIDIKKFTIPFKPTLPSSPSPMTPPTTVVMASRFPDRQPTVQYFPPTTKPPKVNVDEYDLDFEKRVHLFTLKELPKTMPPFEANEPVATERQRMRPTVKPSDFTMFTPQSPESLTKHMYENNEPRVTEPQSFVLNDGNFNRGTYVIKHYRDYLSDAARDDDEERSPAFVPYTVPPSRGVTLDELAKATSKLTTEEADYEYDSQFRKDVLSRFVDNFNQNSDRYKVDFPVLFNTSVVHRPSDEQGRVMASSRTFMKRLYGNENTPVKPPESRLPGSRGCESNCDNITVELSPAYELHYYVPEQEEKEEADPRQVMHRYKL